MNPIAQRDAVVNFIKNKGDTSLPARMSSDVIERLIHERGLILDPLTSRDGVHEALDLLNRGQRLAFTNELMRQLDSRSVYDLLAASPAVICKTLLKVIGKWNSKL